MSDDVVDVVVRSPLEIQHQDFDADKAISLMQKRANFLRRIKAESLRIVDAQDFVDQKGKPYLQATGAEKLGPLWGIYTRDVTIDPDVRTVRDMLESGRQVTVECIGIVGSRVIGEESVFIGDRSSDDDFFGGQQDKLGRMDPGDLRKAAYSNWFANGVSRLLGLRNLSWDEIKGAGHSADKAGGAVQYDRKTPDDASLANKIWKGCLDLNASDDDAARDYLENISAFKGKDGKEVRGIRSFKNVSAKRLGVIWDTVKRDLAEMEGGSND